MDKTELYIKMSDCPEIQRQKPKGNEFSIGYKNPDIWIEHEGSFFYARHMIWLPRQDQIQEMAGLPVSAWGLFYGWVFEKDENRREPWQDFTTGEQLWLAFYMQEKHSKIWSSKEEKWVKK